MSKLLATKSLDQLIAESSADGAHSLVRALGPYNLISLGIGAVIGAGIFVFTGSAAAQFAGPAITISFLLAGIGCAFAGLCYDSYFRIGVHLRIRHARRNIRLDHRVGPGVGICV
jgi:APA family basic amino acid/polyamine antiporter